MQWIDTEQVLSPLIPPLPKALTTFEFKDIAEVFEQGVTERFLPLCVFFVSAALYDHILPTQLLELVAAL